MATTGAAIRTPNTPKTSTHKSMENITATGCSFMLRDMIRGEITLFSRSCTARYTSKTQSGVMPPTPKANRRAGRCTQDGSKVGNRFEDSCDQSQNQGIQESEEGQHEQKYQ